MRILLLVVAAALAGCAGSEFDRWLQSPVVQREIVTMEGFAFTLLNDWIETQMADGSTPVGWSCAEAAIVPQVQVKYGISAEEATYVVRRAEAQFNNQP